MGDQEISERLKALEEKVELIFQSAEKTRKYFLWALIIGVAVTVLPLFGLLFAIPSFLSSYSAVLSY